MLVGIATEYNDALLVVERENVGWSVLQTIIEREYKNLFYMSKDHKIVETHRTLTNRYASEEQKMLPGFSTSVKTRPLIISKLDTYMRDRAITIRSLRTIKELEVFIWDNHKAQAMQGYNDDLVMALCIGLWIRDVALRIQQTGIDLTKIAIEGITRVGGEGMYVNRPISHDPYVMPSANGNALPEDIRWLFR